VKIYAVADIHGNLEKLELIKSHVSDLNPDVLVIAGDITNKTDPSSFVNLVNDLHIPVLAIRGESDIQAVENLFDECPNITALHLKKTSFGGISFVGLSGVTPRAFRNGNSYSGEIIKEIELFIDRKSIVVTHLPPLGYRDESFFGFHSGCRRLHDLLLKRQPAVLICGHAHDRSSIRYIGKTQVVNCSIATSGAGAVLKLFDGEVIYSDML
jgi:Icc-related predicted phosphoesterase